MRKGWTLPIQTAPRDGRVDLRNWHWGETRPQESSLEYCECEQVHCSECNRHGGVVTLYEEHAKGEELGVVVAEEEAHGHSRGKTTSTKEEGRNVLDGDDNVALDADDL